MFVVSFLFFFLFLGQAFGQEVPGMCAVDITVNCVDCEEEEEFVGEIYRFIVDERGQMAHNPHLKSGDLISSGRADPGRRTLVINDEEVWSVGCVSGADRNLTISFSIHGDEGVVFIPGEEPVRVGRPIITAPDFPPVAAPPVPEPVPVLAEAPPVVEPPPARPTPTVTVTRVDPPAERVEGSVEPHVAGWATPGGDPVWIGSAGHFPSSSLTNKRGKFADSGETRCPVGKLPAVLGTADAIRGGRQAQDTLDDQRAKDLAPPDWDGSYAFALRTAITGDQAAAVWCVDPLEVTPISPEGREMVAAAEPPPPVPPGVSPEDLERMATQLREELKPPPVVEPLPVTPVPEPLPFVLRKGAFMAFQYSTTFSEGVAYPHALAGGFVTFNLTPKTGRLGLEPYIGAGTDAESSHPCGVAEDGSLTMCSGWYLSTTAGVRLPVAVIKKDTFQLLVFPDLGLVSDDITVGFTSWGDLVSFQAGAELWLTGKVPFAVSLETGATRLSFLNDSQSHTNGWAWPIRLEAKVAFQ